MNKKDRREAIVKAALPLFARQGFANTTTKQLAHAAKVSEALLYKHFPSKEHLYDEIKGFGSKFNDSKVQRLMTLEPSTSTLTYIVYYMMLRFLGGKRETPIDWDTRTRLFLHSCLEDGSFLSFLFKNRFVEDMNRIMESVHAARKAGDLVDEAEYPLARMIFVHQLAIMLAGTHLPAQPPVDFECPREELVNQASLFALRGIGMKEEAIKRYFKPQALALFMGSEFH